MKTTISKTFFLRVALCTSLLIYLTSCSPDDGTDGINGTNGSQGPVGSANVIYSNWTPGSVATATNIDGTNGLAFLLPANPITQDILDKGTILVYAKFSTTILPLPHTSFAGGEPSTITYYPEVGGIRIFRFRHSGVGTTSLSTSLNYRYIIIPGGVPSGKLSRDFKKMTYEEVCNYYSIKQ
jgi:hypothetical protein